MLVLALLLAPAGAVDFDLYGSCPGAQRFTIDALAPGAAVALLTGTPDGAGVLRGGPCGGVVTGLGEPRFLARRVDDDFDGTIAFDRVMGPDKCGMPLQVLDLTTCDVSTVLVVGSVDLGDCPGDWLLGTPCNGADFGGGCTPDEPGYHYKGIYDGDVEPFACWWHTKNQAWNTDTSSNFHHLAEAFGLETGVGGSQWCHSFASDPCGSGACVASPGGYFDLGDVGAWGWCGGDPFTSGGHVCVPVSDDVASRCR
ncbi:MAG: hypothetical protein ACI8PZ_006419 [Myxococcota bacterium]|jgi:hypothetical protein